jgi:hypothetical protein
MLWRMTSNLWDWLGYLRLSKKTLDCLFPFTFLATCIGSLDRLGEHAVNTGGGLPSGRCNELQPLMLIMHVFGCNMEII